MYARKELQQLQHCNALNEESLHTFCVKNEKKWKRRKLKDGKWLKIKELQSGCKMWRFGLQKVMFWSAKGDLLAGKSIGFGTQKWLF